MADTRFFKNITNKDIQRSVISPIEVRGDVFRALAFAIIDNLKSGARLPDVSFKKIVDRLANHFPDVKKNQANLSLEPEISGCLAFVLRQLAVDEVLTNPSLYQEFFSELSRDLPKDILRQMDTPLHPCVVDALARILNITVIFSIKNAEKELRACRVLNKKDCSSNFNVTLQVQDGMYFPCVRNQAYFSALGQLPFSIPTPVMPTTQGTLAESFAEIDRASETMWQKYEQYRRILTNIVEAKQLTSHVLSLLYGAFLPDEANINLFMSLEKKYNKTIVKGPKGNLEHQKIKMLINAFAGGLSTGEVDEDEFFDAIELSTYRYRSRAS